MKDGETEVLRHARVDEQVLAALVDSSGTLAFNGLRRALHVHPESLTRALRRLERDGMVLRSENGYALREPVPSHSPDVPKARTIASVRLPSEVSAADLLGRLAGRWVGPLRWLGLFEHPGDPWLVWSVAGGARHVMLSARRGTLRVLSDSDPKDQSADDAAFALLARALEEVRQSPADPSPGILTLSAEELPPRIAG